jgi:hypothetical protein
MGSNGVDLDMKIDFYPMATRDKSDRIRLIIGSRYINFEFLPVKFWKCNIWLFDFVSLDRSIYLETPTMVINSWIETNV